MHSRPAPFILLPLLAFALAAFASDGTFTDPRDGKKYKTVKIGEQTWMVENLNYNASGSKCYDNEPANCEKYGRLYDWNTAMTACPKGWHLPSYVDWDKLVRFADGTSGTESPYKSKTAGKFLKATSGWNDYQGESGGEDKFGFVALPGGYGYLYSKFYDIGKYGSWWSTSEYDAYNAYGWGMNCIDGVYIDKDSKDGLYSVRCVGD